MAVALTGLVLAAKDTDYFSYELCGATSLAHRFISPSTSAPTNMFSYATSIPKLSRPKITKP